MIIRCSKRSFRPKGHGFGFSVFLSTSGIGGPSPVIPAGTSGFLMRSPVKAEIIRPVPLSDEQREENRASSKIGIPVENAICGLKRCNILVHRFRSHRKNFDDDAGGIAAALRNFNLRY